MLDTLSIYIYCILNNMPGASVKELAQVTTLEESIIQEHIDLLLKCGLVEECHDGEEYKVA